MNCGTMVRIPIVPASSLLPGRLEACIAAKGWLILNPMD